MEAGGGEDQIRGGEGGRGRRRRRKIHEGEENTRRRKGMEKYTEEEMEVDEFM